MIEKLSIKNFRNFSWSEFCFVPGKNIIIWKNGHGKSNILEALSLPAYPFVESQTEYLVKRWESILHISYVLDRWIYSYSYDKQAKKKRYFLWKSASSKNKLALAYPHVVVFHPLVMNMMYLWPSERRDFIDGVLSQACEWYKKSLSEYKRILTNRNKILKNIFEKKSQVQELSFWNQEFIRVATEIYVDREKFILFLQKHIWELEKYFFWKVKNIKLLYISKVDLSKSSESLNNYISNFAEKEILARRTLIWPHLDDFNILLDDDIPLIHFASRWEVKSSILALKFLETRFIEHYSPKQEILFLIDDLLSELDHEHRDVLWKHIWNRQSILSSIEDTFEDGNKIFI